MIHLVIHYDDGDTAGTRFNGTLEEATAYYVGQTFNVGLGPEDNLKRCVRIQLQH